MKPRTRRERQILRWRSEVNRIDAHRRRTALRFLTEEEWDMIRRIARFRETLQSETREAYERQLLVRIFPELGRYDRAPAGEQL